MASRKRTKGAAIPTQPFGKPIQVLPGAAEKNLRDAVAKQVAQNMNLAPDQLSQDVSGEIDRQVKLALSESVRDVTRVSVSENVKKTLSQGVALNNVMQDRLKGALAGLQTVNAQNETKQILDQNAMLLRMKYDALINVKFTQAEAMDIILADLGKPRR